MVGYGKEIDPGNVLGQRAHGCEGTLQVYDLS